MAARLRIYAVVFLAIVVGSVVVWWVVRTPDPGAVDKVRDEPEALGTGLPQSVGEPVTTLTSSMGDPTGNPSGTVSTGSLLIEVEDDDDERLTARSLVDGEPVWTYGREEQAIDGWAVSEDAAWVLFEDHLLVRVDVEAAEVADSTVVDGMYDGDTAPSLIGDGSGGVVLQGEPTANKPVRWVGDDLEPVTLRLPDGCDEPEDVTSDGDRIFLIASCGDDQQRVVAFDQDGTREWVSEGNQARSLDVDREHLVVHHFFGSQLLALETGDVAARVPSGDPGLSYVAASGGLVAAWEGNAPRTRPSLAVWSVDQQRFVWRLPGADNGRTVSAPLLSDGFLYFARVTYGGDEPRFGLVVVNIASGEATSTELTSPGPSECEGGPTQFRPNIAAGIPGGIVVSWQDGDICADPVLEVYPEAS